VRLCRRGKKKILKEFYFLFFIFVRTEVGRIRMDALVATQDRVFSYYAPNSSIKHSKSDSKDRSQEIL
jgi:hypothetical protein